MTRLLKITIVLLVVATLVAGCASRRDRIDQDTSPAALYERGRSALDASNYPLAINFYQVLQARYPFANESRQALLDLIYTYWRSNQPESAIEAAERFERENPTHPQVAYSLYMRGLVWYDEDPNILERLFRVDMSARPPKDTLQSFAMFQRLIREYPDSEYVSEARERMVYLRNRLAAFENHVADYYVRRQAYVAAVNRAQYALEHYEGAPALERSLEIMAEAYDLLGMSDLAEDARRVRAETFGAATGSTRAR
jgi:outer membrane protein assembly factor BamD